MSTENGGYVFIHLCFLIYVAFSSSKPSSNMLIPCNKEGIIITGVYNRYTDSISIKMRLFQSFDLIHLNGTHLIPDYSWINVEGMTIERLFAEQQVVFLRGLASLFPNARSVMISYMVAADEPLIALHVDNSSTISQGKYGVFSSGWNGNALRPYANGTHFSMLLGAKDTLLFRWRKLCDSTKKKDIPDNMTMSFLYDPAAYLFKCEIITRIPMRYYLYLEGGGCKTAWGKIMVTNQDETIIGRVINRSQCKFEEVKCIVMSPHGWERTLTPPTIHTIVTNFVTIGHTSNITEQARSRMGIYLTIVFVCLIFFILLVSVLVIRRKSKSSANIANRIQSRFYRFSMSG